MQETPYIWKNGQLVEWHDAHTHVLSHSLHYGSAVFEGIRCYETTRGPAVFKLDEHLKRFFYSAEQMSMELPYTLEQLRDETLSTLRANAFTSGYIRHLAYYGYGSMIVLPKAPELQLDLIIACWPWGAYMEIDAIDVKTSDFIRIHPKSTVEDAKISGHYANSILAQLAIHGTKYHEALFLDDDGYVAEVCTANIFIIKDGKLITTPPGTILPGITRNTIMDLATTMDIPVTEQKFRVEDIYNADEAFVTGTAVEVCALRSVDDQIIADGKPGPVTEQLKASFNRVVHGEDEAFHQALTLI